LESDYAFCDSQMTYLRVILNKVNLKRPDLTQVSVLRFWNYATRFGFEIL